MRKTRRAHQMLAHRRTECYPLYRKSIYPAGTLTRQEDVCVTQLERQIDSVKRTIGYLGPSESSPGQDIQERLNRADENPPDTQAS